MSATGPGAAPRLAVIVPAHDAGRYVAETLRSVQEQTFGAWECIVVDDGSTDDTAAVVGEFVAADSRFRLVRQANAGVSAARNAGLDAVSGSVTLLAFLDSDDTWTPDAVAVLVAALDAAGDDTVGVYGHAEYMDAASRPLRAGAHAEVQADRRRLGRLDLVGVARHEPSTFATLVVSGTIWPSGVGLHRRAAVERAGRFDPEQRYVEDWDLYLRMSRHGDFRPVDRQVAWYRRHGDNLTGHDERMAFFLVRLRWKTARAVDNTPAQFREGQRVWRRLQLRWVYWAAGAVLTGVRARDREQTAAAVHALVVFGRQLLAARPPAPDAAVAELVARFVVPRAAGRGAGGVTGGPAEG